VGLDFGLALSNAALDIFEITFFCYVSSRSERFSASRGTSLRVLRSPVTPSPVIGARIANVIRREGSALNVLKMFPMTANDISFPFPKKPAPRSA
jgi:hypothetical protein